MYKFVLLSFITANLVQVVTTVNLFHSLGVDKLPPSPPNPLPENSILFEDSPPSYSKQFEGRDRPPFPPPNGDPVVPDDSSDIYHGNPFLESYHRAGGIIKQLDSPPSYSTQFEGKDKPPFPPPDGDAQFGGQTSQSPPLRKNLFQFNPVIPDDPSEIYHGNPFLGTPAEKHYRPGGIFKWLEELELHLNQEDQVSQRKDDISSAPLVTNFSPKGKSSPKVNGQLECGLPILTNHLINNGEAVPRGAYPWLGALYRIKPSGYLFVCSVSLISNRHVVTAAHCVKNQNNQVRKPEEFVIILGKQNLQRWGRYTEGEKMVEPESISAHPDHEESSADADIAVIVLSESVRFSKYVLPLCLWREDTDLQEIVGMEGIVVGWGKDLNGVLMTDEPKQTKLPIVGQETCLRSSFEFLHVTSNRTFCAGFRNGDGPCNGDSGSGFIMKRNGRWTLRGVVSMSLRDTSTRSCDLSNYVVFTDASKYLDWLISFIK